ncbi:hypothetical protein Hanom_Chr09g00768251 [Helianthus anomalus]
MFCSSTEKAALYQSAFRTFFGTMGVRPLRDGEEYWYEQIKPNFMYARAELFAALLVATEGAHIPNPRPCHAMTPAGKEIVYLSREEYVASSDHELRSWDDVSASVLRDLGIDHEKKKPKKVVKKKVTVAGGMSMKKTETTGVASDVASMKGTSRFRQSKSSSSPNGPGSCVMCSRIAGSKGPDSSASPSSIVEETETETKPEAEKLIRKRPRAETTDTTPPAKNVATGKPIGKKGSLRSHYSDVSPEAVAKKPEVEVKKAPSCPKFNIIDPKTTVVEGKSGEIEKTVEKETAAYKAGKKPIDITLEVLKTPKLMKDTSTGGGDAGESGADARKGASGKKPRQPLPIRAEDTLGDIYYKTEWTMGTFPPTEVHLQKDHGHDNLHRSYVLGQANASSAGHQILREWRTMHLDEDTLTKEHREWSVACDNENKKLFVARTKITNLEAQVEGLKKSKADFKASMRRPSLTASVSRLTCQRRSSARTGISLARMWKLQS